MTDTFTCAKCKQTFEKTRTDEESLYESQREFGYHPPEDLVVICDDCYLAAKANESVAKNVANLDPVILNILGRLIAKDIIGI